MTANAARPLGGPTPTTAPIVLFTLFALFVADSLALRLATGGAHPPRRDDRDRFSYWTIQAAQLAGLGLALMAPRWVKAANVATGTRLFVAAGLVMMLGGIVLRAWSILTLGRFFDRKVTVQEDHRVVATGPYAWVRHPSYTAVLLAFVGFGLAQANWLSLAAVLVIPTAAYIRRISVEQRALTAELGSDYESYAASHRRLLPGILLTRSLIDAQTDPA